MKRLLLIINLSLLLVILSGCEHKPKILIKEGYWAFDNISIKIEKEYHLNRGHSYDIEYTDDGMNITIHFEK